MSETLKVHVALNTPKLAESVEFYRAFFGIEPAKLKPGYAKFDVAEPPLNLTLNASTAICFGALNHLGIQVGSTEAVRQAAARLEAAGLATSREDDTDCCYALQDKIWVTDPNGYRWEVVVVKVGDTRPDLAVGPYGGTAVGATCCASPGEGLG